MTKLQFLGMEGERVKQSMKHNKTMFMAATLLVSACSDPAVDMGSESQETNNNSSGGSSSTGGSGTSAGGMQAGSASTGGAGGTSGTSTGGSGGSSGSACLAGKVLELTDANNYTIAVSTQLSLQRVAPNSEVTFDWSELTTDLSQQALDPTSDVHMLFISLLQRTPEGLEAVLNANEPVADYAKAGLAYYPQGETNSSIYESMVPGVPELLPIDEIKTYLDPALFEPSVHTYLVMVQDSTEVVEGVRMLSAFQLDPETDNTEVVISNQSLSLSYSVDLASAKTTGLQAGRADVVLDWSGLGVKGPGGAWDAEAIGQVSIGHYSLSPQELNQDFLALEALADELYRGEVSSLEQLSLKDLKERDSGEPFKGIDDTGTWLLSLECSTCLMPVPWFVSVLEPCD